MAGFRADPPQGPQGRADFEARSAVASAVPPCPPWLSPEGRRVPAPLIPSNGPRDAPACRDALRHLLRSIAPGVTDWRGLGPNGASGWLRQWQAAVAEVGGIESTREKPYRTWNFERCSGARKQGILTRHTDGVTTWVPYRCGESLCPECADKIGDDLGREYGEVYAAAASALKLRRVWFIVATLPREVEAAALPGSEEGRACRRGLVKLLRQAFGARARAQIPMYLATHAVGDRSLMRPRVHYHAGVLPVVLDKMGVHPVNIRSLDVDALREAWGQVLRDVFGRSDLVPQLHVSWVDPIKSPAKLHHRVRYDCRAFGADFRDSALAWSPSTGVVVVQEGAGWRVLHVLDLARQWAWARRQREVRPYGPLQYRRRVAEQLGIEQFVEDAPPVEDEFVAMAWLVRRKRYDPKTQRVRWVEQVTYWLDLPEGLTPVQGVEPGRGGQHWRVILRESAAAPPRIREPDPPQQLSLFG